MVIRRGTWTWGSNISKAEIHLSDESECTNLNVNGECMDSWSKQLCNSSPNSENQVKWVSLN